jgi:hypothetical protein
MFKQISFILFTSITSQSFSAQAIWPAEVIGRDMQAMGFGFLGHVGVTTAPYIWQDAFQVIEVLNNHSDKTIPVIQTNFIFDFKSRSPYWGSRYGIADRGDRAISLLREANFQRDMGCTTYTITPIYTPSRGRYDPSGKAIPSYCGFFRCDTFVNYVFSAGGYFLPTYTPSGADSGTTPRLVFNTFPYGNGDGPYSMSYIKNTNDKKPNNQTSIKEIYKHSTSYNLKKITNDLIFAKNELIDPQKRIMKIDKLGFTAQKTHIPEMIKIYQLTLPENIEIKRQVLSSTQNLYQRYLYDNTPSKEKIELIKFYKELLHDNHLEAYQAQQVLRGFISLAAPLEIKSQLIEINQQLSKLHPKFQLGLQIELINKSQEFEKIYIPEIINLLQTHHSAELDDSFNLFMINRLTHAGINDLFPESKLQIASYLASVQDKYTTFEARPTDSQITMFSWGKWLEATALMNSSTFEEAGKYINHFLENKNDQEQITYVIGFSSSEYLKNAFSKEPTLVQFKHNNKNWYDNSVGLIQEHQ